MSEANDYENSRMFEQGRADARRPLPVVIAHPPADDAASAASRAIQRRDSYAPGPIRASTDVEATTLERFRHRHPEYAKLGSDAIVQAMSTYLTDEEAEVRKAMADEGVPVDVICGFRPADPIDPEGA